MNDRLTIAAMLMARDWPNITRDEAIAAIPELLEMADALLAAAGEQDIAADLKESDSIIVTLQEQLSAALEDNEAMRKNLAPIMEERLVYQARAEAAEAKLERIRVAAGKWKRTERYTDDGIPDAGDVALLDTLYAEFGKDGW